MGERGSYMLFTSGREIVRAVRSLLSVSYGSRKFQWWTRSLSLSLYFVLAYFIASCFGIQTSRCRLHTKANAGKLVINILACRAGVILQTNGGKLLVIVTSSFARVWLAGRRPWFKKKTWCLFCFFKPSPESVPYRVALKNHKILLSSTESKDSLEQQVSHFYSWESVFG